MELIMNANWAEIKELALAMGQAQAALPAGQVRYAFEAWNFAYAGFRPTSGFERLMGRLLNNAVLQNYVRFRMGLPKALK